LIFKAVPALIMLLTVGCSATITMVVRTAFVSQPLLTAVSSLNPSAAKLI